MMLGLALALVMLYAAIIVLACVGWLIEMPATSWQSVVGPDDPLAADVRMLTDHGSRQHSQGMVTVIVPFRNEEQNLFDLLLSLHRQNFSLEVILVNDHSTDDFEKIIRQFMDQHPGTLLEIRVLLNTGEGKKQASLTGLKTATHSQIVFTDADCVFPQGFFEQVSAAWIRDAGFVYGPVIYDRGSNFLGDILFLDQLALNTVAIGLGGVGIHTYCSGANMGGNKEKLLQAGDDLVKTSNLSGDDVTYLQHAVRQKQKIKVLTGPALTVKTKAPAGWAGFFAQRLRWGQKAPGYRSPALLALSACVWLVCCMVLAVLIGCFSGKLPLVWWVLPLAKLLIDLLFLFLVALKMKITPYLWAFLPAWLLNLLYIPAMALLGLMMNPTWKGRKVKRSTIS